MVNKKWVVMCLLQAAEGLDGKCLREKGGEEAVESCKEPGY